MFIQRRDGRKKRKSVELDYKHNGYLSILAGVNNGNIVKDISTCRGHQGPGLFITDASLDGVQLQLRVQLCVHEAW